MRVGGTNWVGSSPRVGVAPALVTVGRIMNVVVICGVGVAVARSRGAMPNATKPMI